MGKKISVNIEEKIFSKADIIRLANIFKNIYDSTQSKHKKYDITLGCTGNETHQFSDTSSLDSLLDLKRILSISYNFHVYDENMDITLQLNHGESSGFWYNTLSVSASQDDWVTLKHEAIMAAINAVHPQSTWFRKYEWLIFNISSINVGWLCVSLLIKWMKFINYQSSTDKPSGLFSSSICYLYTHSHLAMIGIYLMIFWTFGTIIMLLLWWGFLRQRYFDLWPSVEFDFGPEHLRKEKITRKVIGAIIALFGIPIILQILFKVVKL
ncbi:MAG: hypothetical protein ABSF80_01725 [Chitinispirillaceae bacterium]|jgi:hypothetical protein